MCGKVSLLGSNGGSDSDCMNRGVSTASKARKRVRNCLYWTAILTIVALYAQRTILRNPDWKNDATLHISSLNVCSRSAKLQLQVTKLKLNEGKFEEAARHVALAKEIDPEFCDVWYQEALLNIAYYHDMDAAIEKLADSLQCIFTNTGVLVSEWLLVPCDERN